MSHQVKVQSKETENGPDCSDPQDDSTNYQSKQTLDICQMHLEQDQSWEKLRIEQIDGQSFKACPYCMEKSPHSCICEFEDSEKVTEPPANISDQQVDSQETEEDEIEENENRSKKTYRRRRLIFQKVTRTIKLAMRNINILNERGKATNVPKSLVNFLLKAPETHVDPNEKQRWRDVMKKRYPRNAGQGNLPQLVEIFAPRPGPHGNDLNLPNRKLMQNFLKRDKDSMVLRNKDMSQDNKFRYLYFYKIFEWRLNNAELSKRVS